MAQWGLGRGWGDGGCHQLTPCTIRKTPFLSFSLSKPYPLRDPLNKEMSQKIPVLHFTQLLQFLLYCHQQPKSLPKRSAFNHT